MVLNNFVLNNKMYTKLLYLNCLIAYLLKEEKLKR